MKSSENTKEREIFSLPEEVSGPNLYASTWCRLCPIHLLIKMLTIQHFSRKCLIGAPFRSGVRNKKFIELSNPAKKKPFLSLWLLLRVGPRFRFSSNSLGRKWYILSKANENWNCARAVKFRSKMAIFGDGDNKTFFKKLSNNATTKINLNASNKIFLRKLSSTKMSKNSFFDRNFEARSKVHFWADFNKKYIFGLRRPRPFQ